MKYHYLFLSLILASTTVFGQNQKMPVSHSLIHETSGQIVSGLYSLPEASTEHTFFSGSTSHFSSVILRLESWPRQDGKKKLGLEEEQIVIIKDGQAKVTLNGQSETIGPNSVMFLLPGEDGTIESLSSSIRYYRMIYTGIHPVDSGKFSGGISSFIIDAERLAYNDSEKGGVRRYFNTSTITCPYYEMHVTTLNPGLQSHPPHTHEAEEIVLMIEGETEELIGETTYPGRDGDVYFTGSNVPHAIRNVGDKPCRYFAFQWPTQ